MQRSLVPPFTAPPVPLPLLVPMPIQPPFGTYKLPVGPAPSAKQPVAPPASTKYPAARGYNGSATVSACGTKLPMRRSPSLDDRRESRSEIAGDARGGYDSYQYLNKLGVENSAVEVEVGVEDKEVDVQVEVDYEEKVAIEDERYGNRYHAQKVDTTGGPSSPRFNDARRDSGSSTSNRRGYNDVPFSNGRFAAPPGPRYSDRDASPANYSPPPTGNGNVQIATRLASLFSTFLYMPLEKITGLHKSAFKGSPAWPAASGGPKFIDRLRQVAAAAPHIITVHTFVINRDSLPNTISYLAVPNRLRDAPKRVTDRVGRLHALVPPGQRVQNSVLLGMYRRVYEPENGPANENVKHIRVEDSHVRDFIASLRDDHRLCCEIGLQDSRVGGGGHHKHHQRAPMHQQPHDNLPTQQHPRQSQPKHRYQNRDDDMNDDREGYHHRDEHDDDVANDDADEIVDRETDADPDVLDLSAAEDWLNATFGPAHLFFDSPDRHAPSKFDGAYESMAR
ncbi:hypothetical protein BDK51DRAFT_26519 [Blyttiomyces helicus]|uniref:Uncharacterized protein n=1 Tax=Blyttiomyces helicus TaxID=388810 RepID=A0A4P9VV80_9FUNG|nr:hypothetical protein BDK51DRAFT_26519 [Blyttiomyces helicus]|eukprot:RKO83541.1 hypothetical protein BDK51DRAFT_26519 [Blyttiomyces helicus]